MAAAAQRGFRRLCLGPHSTHPAREIAARFERWQKVDEVVASPVVGENLVGNNPGWISVLRQIVEVAIFTDASVLITGESGTGKELVARLIHSLDAQRQKRDLVVLDCTTIVPELSGSEFFGHERGAFTGAVAARDGAFALANAGTLFLDEVGELPLTLQAELLRVVQERTYRRVGSNVWQQTDFRLVCATNRDLLQEESQGRFRRDLYYRIAAWTCKLPSLRDHPEDILPLAEHFLRHLRPNHEPEMDQAVRDYLCQRAYPGNVRDLKQVVSRMSYRHVGPGPLTAGDIPQEERPTLDAAPSEWRDGSFEAAIGRAVGMGIGLKRKSATPRSIPPSRDGGGQRQRKSLSRGAPTGSHRPGVADATGGAAQGREWKGLGRCARTVRRLSLKGTARPTTDPGARPDSTLPLPRSRHKPWGAAIPRRSGAGNWR